MNDLEQSGQLRQASTEQLLRGRSQLLSQLREGSQQGMGSQFAAGLMSGAIAAGTIGVLQWVGRKFGVLKSGVFSKRILGDMLGFGAVFGTVGFFEERNRQTIYRHFDQINTVENALNERHMMAQPFPNSANGLAPATDAPPLQDVSKTEHKGMLTSAMELSADRAR